MTHRILVVDDEPDITALVAYHLARAGFRVSTAANGPDALKAAREEKPDIVILDLMLPGISGYDILAELRKREETKEVGVILLTARREETDRIRGLSLGADDYLTKPFSFAELLARLRALTRRGVAERPTVLEAGSLRLDPATREVWRGGVQVELSAKEFALLETLMRRPGQVLSRLDLLDHAWDYAYVNRSNVVDVYVRYLRDKIDRPFGLSSIETVRGAGYRLRRDGE
jgi:two-component system OmpR family response regulator